MGRREVCAGITCICAICYLHGSLRIYLVKTKHNNVADNIVNCCDNADCDFCIAL